MTIKSRAYRRFQRPFLSKAIQMAATIMAKMQKDKKVIVDCFIGFSTHPDLIYPGS